MLREGLERRGFEVVGEVPGLSAEPRNIGSGESGGRPWILPGFSAQLNAALRMTEVGIVRGVEVGWFHVNVYEYAGSIPAGAEPCQVPWDQPLEGADCRVEAVGEGESLVVRDYSNLREVYVILEGTVVGTVTAAGELNGELSAAAPIVDLVQQRGITEELAEVVR
ncbi:hypothetical protein Ntsu_36560 [Nocardia sp. IFM 10818]